MMMTILICWRRLFLFTDRGRTLSLHDNAQRFRHHDGCLDFFPESLTDMIIGPRLTSG